MVQPWGTVPAGFPPRSPDELEVLESVVEVLRGYYCDLGVMARKLLMRDSEAT